MSVTGGVPVAASLRRCAHGQHRVGRPQIPVRYVGYLVTASILLVGRCRTDERGLKYWRAMARPRVGFYFLSERRCTG